MRRLILAAVVLTLVPVTAYAGSNHWKTSPNSGKDYYIDKYQDIYRDPDNSTHIVITQCYVAYDQSAGSAHPVSISCVKL